jgi:hypothetical protein
MSLTSFAPERAERFKLHHEIQRNHSMDNETPGPADTAPAASDVLRDG